MKDKYKETARTAVTFVLHKLDIEVVEIEEGTQVISRDGTHEDHVARVVGILAVQAELFKHALALSISLKPENEGVITLNAMREQTVTLLNLISDSAIEKYLDNNISTQQVETKP